MDTSKAKLLEVAALHTLSRVSGGKRLYFWRPSIQKFGSSVDMNLAAAMEDFTTTSKSNTIDEIRRRLPENVYRKCNVSRYFRSIFVHWEESRFPSQLYQLFLNNDLPASMRIYYNKNFEAMLPPRIHELSDILGIAGVASVADGNSYYVFLLSLDTCQDFDR
jgi:hypothetical protein